MYCLILKCWHSAIDNKAYASQAVDNDYAKILTALDQDWCMSS